MSNAFAFFRIKTAWMNEAEDGSLNKQKTEELVYAANYTYAEKVAYAIAEDQGRDKFPDNLSIEIIKTKIGEILWNDILETDTNLISGLVCNFFAEDEDSGVGLYAVKVMFTETADNGEEKHSYETIYTPALSNVDANDRIREHLKGSITEFVIRDTKFDKTSSILWSPETHKQKMDASNKI